ncbi:SPT2 chromatin protein [Striga asiatica]|uniref:SPT2 chromatin protein n=1 Tax=Striga asiatica TaxID=4170 RepID=A0A5A7PKH3_STRAF|nr:SPT2 chromatin protein [Striga asiatica]
MGDYERDEYEDWDEYEEDGDEQEQEVGEDEYEEETHQPTQEELDYLELRQRLKESIRKQMKKELGTTDAGSRDRINGFRKDNYGTFFGPRQPAISQRVIQESKSLLENPDLAARIMKPNRACIVELRWNIDTPISGALVNANVLLVHIVKAASHFTDFVLASSALLFTLTRTTRALLQNLSSQNLEKPICRESQMGAFGGLEDAGSAQQQPSKSNNGVRRPVPSVCQNKPKVGQERAKPPTKPAMDPRKQLGSNNGSGPGRPVGPKSLPSRRPTPITTGKTTSSTSKHTTVAGAHKPARSAVQPHIRKPMPSNMQSGIHKSVPSRAQPSSATRKPSVQQEEYRGSGKPMAMTKQAASSSRDQLRRSPPKAPVRHSLADERPNVKPKRPLNDEAGGYVNIIRSMFGYDPSRFRDDDDDSNMQSNFEDVMREERRSWYVQKSLDERTKKNSGLRKRKEGEDWLRSASWAIKWLEIGKKARMKDRFLLLICILQKAIADNGEEIRLNKLLNRVFLLKMLSLGFSLPGRFFPFCSVGVCVVAEKVDVNDDWNGIHMGTQNCSLKRLPSTTVDHRHAPPKTAMHHRESTSHNLLRPLSSQPPDTEICEPPACIPGDLQRPSAQRGPTAASRDIEQTHELLVPASQQLPDLLGPQVEGPACSATNA